MKSFSSKNLRNFSFPICYTLIMKYIAVVEIPKDCDRRIHKSYDTGKFVDFGAIKDHISVNEGKMPVCYGYLKDSINPIEKDEADVLIFSETQYKTGDEVNVEIIGLLEREDGDHKVIGRDATLNINNSKGIDEITWNLIINYFGFKSPITKVKNREEALSYLQNCS